MLDYNATPESIKQDICKDLSPMINTTEGSYTDTMVGGTALNLWKVLEMMRVVPKCICIDKDSPVEIILGKCEDYGITQKAGTKANAVLTVVGMDGVVIKSGKRFLAADGLEYVATADKTIAGGTANVAVQALEVGNKYNQPAGRITIEMESQSGITNITASVAVGGTDSESMESLVNRYHLQIREPPTSANVYQYRQWAMSVDGVGDALIQPLVNGPGTVGVVIVSPDKLPVDAATESRCKAYIETQRPADAADVTVVSAIGVTINVAAQVRLAAATTLTTVMAAWSARLKSYCREQMALQARELPYSKVGYLLLGIDGVEDYSNLLVNGGTKNITLTAIQVPVIGTVTLT